MTFLDQITAQGQGIGQIPIVGQSPTVVIARPLKGLTLTER